MRGLPELELQNGAAEAAQSAKIENFPIAPQNNPERKTIWLPPYVDDAGQGLLISANTPIYYGDEFQGYRGIDVSLARLIERLSQLNPTPSSFAFLMDSEGRLIAVPTEHAAQLASRALTAQEKSPNGLLGLALNDLNAQLAAITEKIHSRESNILEVNMNGQPALITHATLPDLGLSLIHI